MKLYSKISLLFVVIIIWSCANQLPPGGGEVDKVAPEIIEVYPLSGSTNFDEIFLELTFSEYVDARSVNDAVFISPTIEGNIEYSWSGTTLEIEFEDSLKQNTTYTVTIGTEVKDVNNGNKMRFPYTLVFSTGDEIDHGQVYGTVFDSNYEDALIFAYRASDSTFRPDTVKPDYISQVGENGAYKLLGLSPGEYKIFVVKDALKNFVYDLGDDWYGAPYQEVTLTKTDTLFTDLNFQLTIEDTVSPAISQVTMTDKHHFLIEFNEAVDSSKISANNFFVYDSTENIKIESAYLYKGKAKNKQIFLTIKDTLVEESENYLIGFDIPDLFGNLSDPQQIVLAVNTNPDTLLPKVNKIETLFNGNEIDYLNANLTINFNDGIDITNFVNGVSVLDKNEASILFDYTPIDDASIQFNFEKLKPKSEYELSIDLNFVEDAAGNKLDSIYTLKFSTGNDLKFSGAFGFAEFTDINHELDYFVMLEENGGKGRSYQTQIQDDLTFSLERVVPGEYLIWFFEDRDSTETYYNGSIFPFEASERFGFYPDTLNLRARWPVADIKLEFEN